MQSSGLEDLPTCFFFLNFFPLWVILEKIAFESNSLRGTVFYFGGCTIIGVLLGMRQHKISCCRSP